MKKTVCFVCGKEFYGRDNQIFCSIPCKNYHNNKKTRMQYQAGKYGSEAILEIQKKEYAKNRKILKSLKELDTIKQWHKDQIAELKQEYTELFSNYELMKIKIDGYKATANKQYETLKEMEERKHLINAIAKEFKPLFDKIKLMILKTSPDSK